VLFQYKNVQKEIEKRGIKSENIGTHSMRKGASTFGSSGTTACPSSTAIHLRAGWTIGGVQDSYLRYEKAGDMHVGRTVTGLPVMKAEFGTLPPHFIKGAEDTVESALISCFPGIPIGLTRVAEFALAFITVFFSNIYPQIIQYSRLLYTVKVHL
jgi:hypothetical protein